MLLKCKKFWGNVVHLTGPLEKNFLWKLWISFIFFLNLYHALIPVSFFVHIKVYDAKVLCYVTVFFLKCNLRIAKWKFFWLHVTNVHFSTITNKEDEVFEVYISIWFSDNDRIYKFEHTYKLSFLNSILQNNLEKVWGPISRTIVVVSPPLRSHCSGSPNFRWEEVEQLLLRTFEH